MRRRNKPKVVWLPQTNAFSADTLLRSTWQFASVGVTAVTGGAPALIEVPLVQDGVQSDPLNANSSLADVEESGYRLRRIVGKLYCFIAQSQVTPVEDIYGVTAGLIIRRVDQGTGGSLAVLAGNDQIDPADIANGMDPWIWRRSWLLSNGPDAGPPGGQAATDTFLGARIGAGGGFNFGKGYPGGNLEGPHIDQKTARLVGPEERLFLDVSASPILASGANTSLVIIYEVRVLASMRTNIGNRRNASR